jgi:hypothetical protein
MSSWKSALLFGALQALVGVSALPAANHGILARSDSASAATLTGTLTPVSSPSGATANGTAPATAGGKRRIGYYDAFDWARAAKPELKIEALEFKPDIELKGLTHVILGKHVQLHIGEVFHTNQITFLNSIAFADMAFGDQPWVKTELDQPDKAAYVGYKSQFPGLKVGVAFGGWGFGDDIWRKAMASAEGATELLVKFDDWLKKWDPEGTWFDLIGMSLFFEPSFGLHWTYPTHANQISIMSTPRETKPRVSRDS